MKECKYLQGLSDGCYILFHSPVYSLIEPGYQLGGRLEHKGYIRVYVPSHPHATTNGYAYEHVVIMCEKLGRNLRSHENVHHINGDKKDNKPENLELWSTYQPYGQRIKDKLQWAYKIIEMYGNEK